MDAERAHDDKDISDDGNASARSGTPHRTQRINQSLLNTGMSAGQMPASGVIVTPNRFNPNGLQVGDTFGSKMQLGTAQPATASLLLGGDNSDTRKRKYSQVVTGPDNLAGLNSSQLAQRAHVSQQAAGAAGASNVPLGDGRPQPQENQFFAPLAGWPIFNHYYKMYNT